MIAVKLTVGRFRSLNKIMFDVEAFGLGILRVRVWSVCNDNIIIGNSRITQILGLRRPLVTKPKSFDRQLGAEWAEDQ